MADGDLIQLKDQLWSHEAGLLKGLLGANGVQTFTRGVLSTSGESPGPVSSISIKSSNESRALAVLAGIDREGEPFPFERCGECAPAGFSECPMCAAGPTQDDEASSGARRGGVVFAAVLVVVLIPAFGLQYFRN